MKVSEGCPREPFFKSRDLRGIEPTARYPGKPMGFVPQHPRRHVARQEPGRLLFLDDPAYPAEVKPWEEDRDIPTFSEILEAAPGRKHGLRVLFFHALHGTGNVVGEKMSRRGVGPVFAAVSIGYALLMLAISRSFYPLFEMRFAPHWLLSTLGTILILIGVPFFALSVKSVMRAYEADELVTDGTFRCCRHPLYASWVVFIVPGIVFLMKSWTGMTTPIFMYYILRALVKKEEAYLENVFGSEYREYKKRVPCILPIGRLKSDVMEGQVRS
jgi:protein-S-isoprenylcysteine O-methyltransferase Ste14